MLLELVIKEIKTLHTALQKNLPEFGMFLRGAVYRWGSQWFRHYVGVVQDHGDVDWQTFRRPDIVSHCRAATFGLKTHHVTCDNL